MLAALVAASACAPDVSTAPAGKHPGGVPPTLSLEAVPPLDQDGTAAPVTQLLIASDVSTLDPRGLLLLEGDVSDVAVKGFQQGKPPASADAAVVEATVFFDEMGTLVIAPHRALAATLHTVLDVPSGARGSVTVKDRGLPLLTRLFPPPDAVGETSLVVHCASAPLPPSVRALGRSPAAHPAVTARGALGDAAYDRCVTTQVERGDVQLPVALYADGLLLFSLAPSPLAPGDAAAIDEPPDCGDAPALGPTCARVEDDRLTLDALPSPALALVGSGEARAIAVLTSPLVLAGLTPASAFTVSLRLLDLRGIEHDSSVDLVTADARPHLVLNEALLHPWGAEPAAEWVELFNDGTADVDLSTFALTDAHGTYPLPPAVLAAGAYALLVNASYEAGAMDVPPAPGTLLVPLPHLGKYGLSNAGDALSVLDGDGHASAAPAKATAQGKSLARIAPEAPDGDGSFVVTTPTPGAPNF